MVRKVDQATVLKNSVKAGKLAPDTQYIDFHTARGWRQQRGTCLKRKAAEALPGNKEIESLIVELEGVK
ncbi:hypothetical protein [Methylobacter psychrophilus]|uniref:hypothetical protein n=1 Tax=Methylobacter psychrophilus TaxID=96941 RepID=UPI0021D4E15A|nr:hypothetical protein [Methylobacter psychrophilus]